MTGIDQRILMTEHNLIKQLRCGNEAAFGVIVNQYQQTMIWFALQYVPDYATAEEVVQDTWLGVVRGIDRFEGRCTLRTWIFRILVNRAKTRGKREAHTFSFSEWESGGLERFAEEQLTKMAACVQSGIPPLADSRYAFPENGEHLPESHILWREIQASIQQAIAGLPPSQQVVVQLRDIEGWAAEEVCAKLAISQENQRVLLHRGRRKMRNILEHYFDPKAAAR